MTDDDLLALCVWSEAAGEIPDGKAAVARVVLNRTKRRYMSDGTISGTVLWPNQFSGFYFATVDGHYTRVCHTVDEARLRAEAMLDLAREQTVWMACQNIAEAVTLGSYVPSKNYSDLTDEVVLYLNPDPRLVPHLPAWADPANLVCVIGHHQFYTAPN